MQTQLLSARARRACVRRSDGWRSGGGRGKKVGDKSSRTMRPDAHAFCASGASLPRAGLPSRLGLAWSLCAFWELRAPVSPVQRVALPPDLDCGSDFACHSRLRGYCPQSSAGARAFPGDARAAPRWVRAMRERSRKSLPARMSCSHAGPPRPKISRPAHPARCAELTATR